MKKFACTECGYLYRPALGEEELGIEPGTPFESVSETFSCPSCGSGEDAFFAVSESVNEPDPNFDFSEQEEQHVPFYSYVAEGARVRIGTEDLPHPDEDSHFLEWVALFDEDGEPLETRFRPQGGTEILFEGFEEGDFSEVRSCCSVHGVWRGLPDPLNESHPCP